MKWKEIIKDERWLGDDGDIVDGKHTDVRESPSNEFDDIKGALDDMLKDLTKEIKRTQELAGMVNGKEMAKDFYNDIEIKVIEEIDAIRNVAVKLNNDIESDIWRIS
jgi:hypothetical protein